MSGAETWATVNLWPEDTGLPMTVHAQPRGGARHDVRIKVHRAHGRRMSAANTAEIGVRPVPHLVAGSLRAPDQIAVFQWAALNEQALVDYWNGRIGTRDFLDRLRKVPPWTTRPSNKS